MTDNKNDPRRALTSIIEVNAREARRQVSFRMQHQLIGAFTKRP